MSKVGKINYPPDYRSKKKYPDPRKVFEGMERRAEHQRLKEAVVEAAQNWRLERMRIAATTYPLEMKAQKFLQNDAILAPHIDALIEFEEEK